MATTTKSCQISYPRGQRPPWKIWAIANRCPSSTNYLRTTALLSRTWGTRHPGDTVLKAIVIYDFTKSSRDEMTVTAKEEVLIIKNMDSNWWYIRKLTGGETGYVPATYLEITGTMICSGATPPALRSIYQPRRPPLLLALPYEIRCIIYEHTFINTIVPFNIQNSGLSLPSTCKQLYFESLSYYYNLSSFDGRILKICMQWYLLLPQSTKTFINHMRIRLQNSANFESLFHAASKVLENEGVVVRPVILNMVSSSALRNMKILPTHVLRGREESGPLARWKYSGMEWMKCKKYLVAKVRHGEKIVVVCDRICCMPQWMLEARKIVELCLRQRSENKRFREWMGKAVAELRGRFEEEKSGRAEIFPVFGSSFIQR